MKPAHLRKQIILKKNEHHRVVGGHQWVFSNEIRETKGDPQLGDIVELQAASGLTLGIGFYNPHSLIAVRLLSREIEDVNADFFRDRIVQALQLRERLYPGGTVYRLVYGESDYLPGLIIDRYNDLFAVQTFSFGTDQKLSVICDVLESLFQPAAIVERNESPLRLLEKLPQQKRVLRGTPTHTVISEHGIHYRVNILEGQKTGFFLDQRENRSTIHRFSNGADVLDCFCNDGGFALNAARHGAATVIGVDSSADAIQRATENAGLNSLSHVKLEQADGFERLIQFQNEGRSFDVVVLDPPSFTRSKKNIQSAKKGYRELHSSAFSVLRKRGILLTASCSHHLEPEVFLQIIEEAGRKRGRSIQLLDWRGASPDHPVLPSMPETRYLKFGIFRVG